MIAAKARRNLGLRARRKRCDCDCTIPYTIKLNYNVLPASLRHLWIAPKAPLTIFKSRVDMTQSDLFLENEDETYNTRWCGHLGELAIEQGSEAGN